MKLEEVFQSKTFIENRSIELTDIDIAYFLKTLKGGKRIYEVIPFISVVETLPNELLAPIISEVLKYQDVSAPKKYMEKITRVFSPERVQNAFFKVMVESTDYKLKCKSAGILYCINGRFLIHKLTKGLETKVKMAAGYVWKDQQYKLQVLDVENITPYLKRTEAFRLSRQEVLVSEFMKSQNMVYRYYLSLNISRDIKEHYLSSQTMAKQVIRTIMSDDFPKSASQLIETITGNNELEDLLFNELNWSRRRIY